MPLPLSCVLATTRSGALGKDGTLPWAAAGKPLPSDLKYFRHHTSAVSDAATRQNAVLMGRRTWDGIPAKYRPLSGRLNVVLSRNAAYRDAFREQNAGILTAASLDDALAMLEVYNAAAPEHLIEMACVIGGTKLFEEAVAHTACGTVHHTAVDGEFDADAVLAPERFAAVLERDYVLASRSNDQEENGVTFRFEVFNRCSDASEVKIG